MSAGARVLDGAGFGPLSLLTVGLVVLAASVGGCQVKERICVEGELPVYGERGEGLYCLPEGESVPAGWRVVEVDGQVPVYLDDPGYREFMDTTWTDLAEQHADDVHPSIPPVLTREDS